MAGSVRVYPYLYFNGEAEAALQFYTQALGARINTLIRFHEAGGDFPDGKENYITHAEIEFGENCLMLCDSPYYEMRQGDNVAISVNIIEDANSAAMLHQRLAEDGDVTFPFQMTQWGAYCGMLLDRFGIRWMINCRAAEVEAGAG